MTLPVGIVERGPIEWANDWFHFESLAPRAAAEEFVREMFGERCPDYEANCECCQRWRLLDELLANPFEDPR